jgi:GDPmannose 4,6-dehydratase
MKKRALITGITGQDGAYLAQLLLKNGYEVFGTYRRSSYLNLSKLTELKIEKEIRLHSLELLEFSNILRVVETVKPDEVYNLAAQSFVGSSFDQPLFTGDVDALGTLRILEAIRTINPKIKFYQASTSEMFGKVKETPQTEETPFHPRSPYAFAKLYAHWATVNYREAYGMFSCSGILFNHESPLRGLEFVTRKITSGLARIRNGQQEVLELGNLDAKRDWGFAGDYVQGMWLMLQQKEADDYVLATGKNYSVREFVETAAEEMEMPIEWSGQNEKMHGIEKKSGRIIVKVNPDFYRPAEVDCLIGNAEKAKKKLQWTPQVGFKELVRMMAVADRNRAVKGLL